MTEDPFDTGDLRERVLAAWAASPARFREDANAEEDLVTGGYRDRVLVELAQNAADAAARAGEPGRLLLRLTRDDTGPVLVAANSGTPLDAAGVSALATLRASAKRDAEPTVGRFGVGFAAVLAVSDEPAVVGRAGGVRFSAADTRALVEATGDAGLADEVRRREGHVPVLRLPFPASAAVPAGYDTVVVLPLRDGVAADLVARQLAELDDALLLALPALGSVRVEVDGEPPRDLSDVESRWRVLRREGVLAPELLVDRPVEERARTGWQVAWAVPREPGAEPFPSVPPVLHAPTPCEEPLPWPALLVATVPLEPSRRHVAPGPLTDAVLGEAAAAYAELLAELAENGYPAWRYVPTGLPAGAVDGTLRAALDRVLPGTKLLTAVEDGAPLAPRDAVTIAGAAGADETLTRVLAPRLAGLVPASRPARVVLRQVGVRELELSDVVDALPADPDPGRWRELYAALDPLAVDPLVREALGSLPVPLAGGEIARGARGLVLAAGTDEVSAALARLGARVVHPEAAHPLLERLGAVPAGPRALLELDVVRTAVEASADDEDEPFDPLEPRLPLADAVLTLVQGAVSAGELTPGELPWLADLALTDSEGEPAPAGALARPGSRAARWFDPDEIGLVAAEVEGRWGADVLAAVGVLDGPALVRAADVPVEPDAPVEAGSPADLLEGWDDWCEYVLDRVRAAGTQGGHPDVGPVSVPELLAVRDLDAVAPDALPEVVAAVAAEPATRAALVGRCRAVAAGVAVDVLPYTAWWLRDRFSSPDGGGVVAAEGATDGLAELLPPAPAWLAALDRPAQSALGVVTGLSDVDAGVASTVFDRLADPARYVPLPLLLRLLRRFAELADAGLRWPAPPPRVRGLDPRPDIAGTQVVDADEAVVLESPMYLQRPDVGCGLPAPADSAGALAELFDLPLVGELVPGVVSSSGVKQPVPPGVTHLLPGGPATWCEHDALVVDGHEVDWWVSDSVVHAATLGGLARGLCWVSGAWALRGVVEEALVDPATANAALLDEAFG
ncbi:sacsin N-terminal ATP-binding-like domain-containing protein [Spongisporangium articulatum]|uniref:Sacsin N-terminal ATP-binding-like domain-containing protein n=1 Tax=Spongisporangium articulatum TaxID=3362603 RepID=A0ABW8AH08_9ACTN